MVKGFASDFCRLDKNLEVFLCLFLSYVSESVFGRRGLSLSAVSSGISEVSVILFSKSNSSENSILLICYCLPICFNVSEISCSTGKALSSVASTGETSDGE